MNLDSLLLRWVARSSDALVNFIIAFDAKLDEFLEKADDEVAGFEDAIGDLVNGTEQTKERLASQAAAEIAQIESIKEQRIADTEAKAAAEKAELETKAENAKRSREVIANLKASMPTSN
jgi:hypothetical protein